jgi:hypothetical protein
VYNARNAQVTHRDAAVWHNLQRAERLRNDGGASPKPISICRKRAKTGTVRRNANARNALRWHKYYSFRRRADTSTVASFCAVPRDEKFPPIPTTGPELSRSAFGAAVHRA